MEMAITINNITINSDKNENKGTINPLDNSAGEAEMLEANTELFLEIISVTSKVKNCLSFRAVIFEATSYENFTWE